MPVRSAGAPPGAGPIQRVEAARILRDEERAAAVFGDERRLAGDPYADHGLESLLYVRGLSKGAFVALRARGGVRV